MKNLIDFLFLLWLLIGSPIVAFFVTQHGHTYGSILRAVLNIGVIVEMCGALLIIVGVPYAFATLISRDNKPTFRSWFVGAWLLVNVFVIIGSRYL